MGILQKLTEKKRDFDKWNMERLQYKAGLKEERSDSLKKMREAEKEKYELLKQREKIRDIYRKRVDKAGGGLRTFQPQPLLTIGTKNQSSSFGFPQQRTKKKKKKAHKKPYRVEYFR